MVKLEQEQVGLAEFGTVLEDPDFAAVARAIGLHGVRVEDPQQLDTAVQAALGQVEQAWGFAIAKIKETVLSQGDA